jgi:hypothetical protein
MAMSRKPTNYLVAALLAGALALSPVVALADTSDGAPSTSGDETSSSVEVVSASGTEGAFDPATTTDDSEEEALTSSDEEVTSESTDEEGTSESTDEEEVSMSSDGEETSESPDEGADLASSVASDSSAADSAATQSSEESTDVIASKLAVQSESVTQNATGRWVRQGGQIYWYIGNQSASEGLYQTSSSTWSYVRPEGYVVCGRYVASNGNVYLANSDGLLEAPGWVVSSAYGQGLQRYWVDSAAHACVPGYSTAGWAHYTRPEGYVVRGAYKASNGYVYIANNDGLVPRAGWVVGNYGQGFQRYWVDSAAHACVPGYSTAGWAHYTRPEGYVVRGAYKASNGYVYIANNDGLVPRAGWVVGNYGQGFQRYWVDSAAHACVPGYSTAGWAHYTMPAGYVLRGRTPYKGGILLADNDGRVATTSGWLVTSAYDNGLQRYYLVKGSDGVAFAKVGFFNVGNSKYFGVPGQGFELRNSYIMQGSQLYWANNDGVLSPRQRPSGALGRIWSMSSPSIYLIAIDNNAHQVYIFRGSANNWQTVYVWSCSNGKASTPTVRGTYHVGTRGYSFGHGYTCYYYTQIYGNYLFHSVLYNQGTFNVQDGRLGMAISHGCVRLHINNAKWIYDNIPRGTTIYSF